MSQSQNIVFNNNDLVLKKYELASHDNNFVSKKGLVSKSLFEKVSHYFG